MAQAALAAAAQSADGGANGGPGNGSITSWIDLQAPMKWLDEGVYGSVYLAVDKKTGEQYAVKKLKITQDEGGMPNTAVREIGLLKELTHENVVRFIGVEFSGASRLYIVMEYVERQLDEFLRSRREAREGGLPPLEALSLAQQLLHGLQYCHSKKVIHRDLKPANVLLSTCGTSGQVKLCDFGISRSCLYPNSNAVRLTRDVVTLWYRPPEILLGNEIYGGGADIWSAGCVVSEAMTLQPLFRGDCEFGQLVEIFKHRGTPDEAAWPGVASLPFYNPVFPQFRPRPLGAVHGLAEDAPLVKLLHQLLFLDPARRITARQAVRQPLFRDALPLIAVPPREPKKEPTKKAQELKPLGAAARPAPGVLQDRLDPRSGYTAAADASGTTE